MTTVKNNLNQPLMIGDRSLPSGGEMEIAAIDTDTARLAKRGHVSVFEPEAPAPVETVADPPKTKQEKN